MKAWLRLVRLPNLLTVPGDPVAGYFLAASMQNKAIALQPLMGVVLAALLLYSAGMIWNDVADFSEDCRSRPKRPLPSGRIRRESAFVVALLLAVSGIVVASLAGINASVVAGLLTLCIALYDFGRSGKSRLSRWLGFALMGACRGLSFLMGAAVVISPPNWTGAIWGAAVVISLYISGVTLIAYRETEESFLSCYVGSMIRFMLVIQAVFCFYAGHSRVAAVLALVWVVLMMKKQSVTDSV